MPAEIDFFSFVYRRQLIWHKRFVLRESPPWSSDPILARFKIINMYRELDRCTLYLLEKLKGITSRESLLANIAFYRFFNLDGFYEKVGIEPLERIATPLKGNLIRRLSELKEKGPIFNNAYLISTGGARTEKHRAIIEGLASVSFEEIASAIDASRTPEESLAALQRIPLAGPFLACEMWTDLSYFGFFRQGWTDNDFVNIGPGAKWGLEILYGKCARQERLCHLWKLQEDVLPQINVRLGEPLPWREIAYKNAFSNVPFLSLTNVEGALCEFRKYARLSEGKGKRRYFKPLA